MNTFNDHLDRVDDSRQSARVANAKLLESVLEISSAQKKFYNSQRALSDQQMEIMSLRSGNREIKKALMKALVERDELIIKRKAIRDMVGRLGNQNENLHREADDLLRADEVDSISERFALTEQISLLKEMQDARCKLLNYGFPMSFFA